MKMLNASHAIVLVERVKKNLINEALVKMFMDMAIKESGEVKMVIGGEDGLLYTIMVKLTMKGNEFLK